MNFSGSHYRTTIHCVNLIERVRHYYHCTSVNYNPYVCLLCFCFISFCLLKTFTKTFSFCLNPYQVISQYKLNNLRTCNKQIIKIIVRSVCEGVTCIIPINKFWYLRGFDLIEVTLCEHRTKITCPQKHIMYFRNELCHYGLASSIRLWKYHLWRRYVLTVPFIDSVVSIVIMFVGLPSGVNRSTF